MSGVNRGGGGRTVVLEMEAAGGGEWGGTEGAETDHFATTTGM
jgi:hypothetical protein